MITSYLKMLKISKIILESLIKMHKKMIKIIKKNLRSKTSNKLHSTWIFWSRTKHKPSCKVNIRANWIHSTWTSKDRSTSMELVSSWSTVPAISYNKTKLTSSHRLDRILIKDCCKCQEMTTSLKWIWIIFRIDKSPPSLSEGPHPLEAAEGTKPTWFSL